MNNKVIPPSFLEIKGRKTLIPAPQWRKRDGKENWKVIRTQVLKGREEGINEMSKEG